MLNLSVHWGHVAALAVVNFFFSWLWYSPVLFAKPWSQALKLNPDPKKMTKQQKAMMPYLFASGIVSSFMLVWGLAVLVASFQAMGFVAGAKVGFLAWFAFTLTGSLGTLWEGRPNIVLAINNGLYALTYIVFAGVLAAWR